MIVQKKQRRQPQTPRHHHSVTRPSALCFLSLCCLVLFLSDGPQSAAAKANFASFLKSRAKSVVSGFVERIQHQHQIQHRLARTKRKQQQRRNNRSKNAWKNVVDQVFSRNEERGGENNDREGECDTVFGNEETTVTENQQLQQQQQQQQVHAAEVSEETAVFSLFSYLSFFETGNWKAETVGRRDDNDEKEDNGKQQQQQQQTDIINGGGGGWRSSLYSSVFSFYRGGAIEKTEETGTNEKEEGIKEMGQTEGSKMQEGNSGNLEQQQQADKRGGAFAVDQGIASQQQEAESHQQQQRRRFPWFGGKPSAPSMAAAAATTTGVVEEEETTTLTLEQQQKPQQQAANEQEKLSSLQRARQDAERLWWNNAWMDQIPPEETLEEEEKKGKEEEEVDSDEIVIVLDDDEEDQEAGKAGTVSTVVLPAETEQEKRRRQKLERQQKRQQQREERERQKRERREKAAAAQEAKKEAKEEQTAASVTASSAAATNATSASKLKKDPTPFTSTGVWLVVDALLTAGYSIHNPSCGWKPSRGLRPLRKTLANWTGLHGLLSGKRRKERSQMMHLEHMLEEEQDLTHKKTLLQHRLSSIDHAHPPPEVEKLQEQQRKKQQQEAQKKGPFGGRRQDDEDDFDKMEPWEQELAKYERLKEIDKLMQRGAERLAELATEKDLLQNMPNPLWNYSTTYDELHATRRTQERDLMDSHSHKRKAQDGGTGDKDTVNNATETTGGGPTFEEKLANYHPEVPTKEFNFPPDDLVDDYLDMLFSSERLIKLNHTDLWNNNADGTEADVCYRSDDDEEEDEWLTAQERAERNRKRNKQRNPASSEYSAFRSGEHAGSRWLRNGLGEKIGLAVEMVAYKAVCANIMGILAKSLAAMHGANVMGHADIFVTTEEVPVLPPVSMMGGVPVSTESYASQAFQNAISKKTATAPTGTAGASSSSSSSKKKRKAARQAKLLADSVQRHAVVETLLSQCQIATPLLKLFPLAWQRALIANLVTMITSIMADFVEGVEFQILGHKLELVFKPITEQDVMQRLDRAAATSSSSSTMDSHPARSHASFEAAVQATTTDMADSLQFLDKWHERVLGGDSIRTQIAALIARVVLSLVDDILSASRMDLWSTKTGGPRLVAGLYYRTAPTATSSNNNNKKK